MQNQNINEELKVNIWKKIISTNLFDKFYYQLDRTTGKIIKFR